jgi:hypothetical protein
LLVGPLWYESDAAVRIHLPGRLGHLARGCAERRRSGQKTYHSGVPLAWRNPAAQAICKRLA